MIYCLLTLVEIDSVDSVLMGLALREEPDLG